ncbi:MAG: Gfo/Idh/MocA family oxidoreductase [Planctomycetia bacterium]|nr:Gfo/Idh/MocA family oxidoreductase [Planctomycetia bacterium]
MKQMNRRHFLKAGAVAGAVAAFPAPALIARGANEVVRIGMIGLGGRTDILIPAVNQAPNAKLVSICDPDATRLGARREKWGVEKAHADLRKVIEDKDIDAVVVATCNQWHCLAGIWAMQAGKHVYVEKPLCLSFWEGEQLVKAAKKYNRLCQIGTQMRTDEAFRPVAQKFLHEEKALGKIQSVRVNRFWVRRPIGKRATPLEIPKTVDYNLWLGPSQDVPIYRNQLQYDWHWMWNTGNGETGNWGAHLLDDCRNDIFLDKIRVPKRVMVSGGRVGMNDAGESPNMMVTYFDTGEIPVIFAICGLEDKNERRSVGPRKGPVHGYIAYCEGGIYEKHWGHAVVYDNDGKEVRRFEATSEHAGGFVHMQNFADAVQAGDAAKLNAPIQVGYDSSCWYNAANFAYRLGGAFSKEKALSVPNTGKMEEILNTMEQYMATQEIPMNAETFRLSPMLELDEKTYRFVGDHAAEANALAEMRPGRGEFVVPEVTL